MNPERVTENVAMVDLINRNMELEADLADLEAQLATARREAMLQAASIAWDAIVECAEDNQLDWKPDTTAHDVQEHVNNRLHEALDKVGDKT